MIIENNTSFELLGFPGNGTESNPYSIENLIIAATHDFYGAYCIRIWNTYVFFIIRNCTLNISGSAYGHAIGMYNVTNGRIENCTINIVKESYSYASNGIDIVRSSNLCIDNSYFAGGESGVSMLSCASCSVKSSVFYNQQYYGIKIAISNDIDVLNNILRGAEFPYSHTGIRVNGQSINCTVSENILSNFWSQCINCDDVIDCVIAENSATDSGTGITLTFSNRSQVIFNTITNNEQWGVRVDNHSFNNSFYENVIGDNGINAEDNGHNSTWNSNWYSDYVGIGIYTIPGLSKSTDSSPRPQTVYLPNLFTGIAIFCLILMVPAGAFAVYLDEQSARNESGKLGFGGPSLIFVVLSILIPFGISPNPFPYPLLPELKYELVSLLFNIGTSRAPGNDWVVSYYSRFDIVVTDYWMLVVLPYLITSLLTSILLIGYFRNKLKLDHFRVGVVTMMVVSIILPVAMILPFAHLVFVVPITPLLGLSITYWDDVRRKKLEQKARMTSSTETTHSQLGQ